MKFIAIDPSSTLLGWAVFEYDELLSYGQIDARKADYERRYLFITDELSNIWKDNYITEVAMEETFQNPKLNTAALKVAEMTIRKWAERRGMTVTLYHPSTWKASVVGHGGADKDMTGRTVWLHYGEIFKRDGIEPSEHTIDAIGIGIYHAGIRRWEDMKREAQRR